MTESTKAAYVILFISSHCYYGYSNLYICDDFQCKAGT